MKLLSSLFIIRKSDQFLKYQLFTQYLQFQMKSVIQLTKTLNGFSIVENGQQVNRIANKSSKEKHFNAPKKFSLQTFTIYPYLYNQSAQQSENQKYLILPSKSQWFNLNQVHEIEKKSLPQWFKTRKVIFGAVKPDKFEKNQQLYRKYRNYIVQLAKKSYLSPSQARKGLAGDAGAIIRIHKFLQQWGIINYVYPKVKLHNKLTANNRKEVSSERKDCIDKDKTIAEKNYDKDHLQLLKKITKKLRPICQLCNSICGIIWYEYKQDLFLKQFKSKQGSHKCYIQTSTTPFKYTLRICASCLNNGNIPIVLSIDDFQKQSLINTMTYSYEEPKDKKKIAEQNKIIQAIQKNKFNLKKCAQMLKMNEQTLYEYLMFIPLVKIQKMSRIDQSTDTESEEQQAKQEDKSKFLESKQFNGVSEANEQELLKEQFNNLQEYIDHLNIEEMNLYEKFIQSWLLKVIAKMGKLSTWEKSTKWYANQLIIKQKNIIAEMIKKS